MEGRAGRRELDEVSEVFNSSPHDHRIGHHVQFQYCHYLLLLRDIDVDIEIIDIFSVFVVFQC